MLGPYSAIQVVDFKGAVFLVHSSNDLFRDAVDLDMDLLGVMTALPVQVANLRVPVTVSSLETQSMTRTVASWDLVGQMDCHWHGHCGPLSRF
jgi:hypothetical protein